MKIAIIGYGKMGRAVEDYALQCGHEVVLRLDAGDEWPEKMTADVAIEFTSPASAADNLLRLIAMGIPTVCGTTGWYSRYEEVRQVCTRTGGRLIAATNFSLGMNIMFLLNQRLAELMKNRPYQCSITEVHHVHKLDSPSGTALTLRDQIVQHGGREAEEVPIASVREGEMPGTHTVVYTSDIDTLTLQHEAHNRKGLAQGAVVAAEWLLKAEPGVYTMSDVLS